MLINNKIDLSVLGYLDDQGPSLFYEKFNLQYLGKLEDWKVNPIHEFLVVVENVRQRIKYVEYISGEGGNFLRFIHPSVEIGKRVTIGEGTIVGPNCFVGDYSHLGSFSILTSEIFIQNSVSIGLFCLLKDRVCVGEGISLGDGNLLGERTVLKSYTGNFSPEFRKLDFRDEVVENFGNIPWFGLN